MDGLFYVLLVAGTEVAGDDHAAAQSDAVEKADDQKGQVGGGADGGKGVVVRKITHHPGVR